MDRSRFYAELRKRGSGVFGTALSQSQVNGTEAVLDEAEKRSTPRAHLAYMLATDFHETAHTMQPIHERGKVSYFDKYEPGTKIGQSLGNSLKGDGFRFRGRGLVQLTGRRNYGVASKKLGVDFVANPDRAIELRLAVAIMFDGMADGWFTSKKLSDYDGAPYDYKNARRIINGTDRAAQIAGYAGVFEGALKAADYTRQPVKKLEPAAPKPDPIPDLTDAEFDRLKEISAREVGPDFKTIKTEPSPKKGLGVLLAALFSAFARMLGRK